MSGFTQTVKKAARNTIDNARDRIQEAGESGKFQIFTIPYLNSIKDDEEELGEAKLLGTQSGKEFTVPPEFTDFRQQFDSGCASKLDGIWTQIDQSITTIKKLCNSADIGDLLSQPGPGTMMALAPPCTITVTATKALWKEVNGNPAYLERQAKKFREMAEQRINECYTIIEAQAKDALSDLRTCMGGFKDADAAFYFAKKAIQDANDSLVSLNNMIVGQVSKCQTGIKNDCSGSLFQVITSEIKSEKKIIATKGKKAAAVGGDAAVIGAHAAHLGGSFGTTAPLAIAGIARAGIDAAQEVKDCLLTLDMLAMEINGYILTVATFYLDGKKKQMAEEGAITIIQAVTCIDMPTVKTCYKKIEEYEYKITLLESSRDRVRRQQQAVRDKLDDYQTMYKDQVKIGQVSAEQKKEWGVFYANVTEIYVDLMIIGDDKDKRIDKAKENVVIWKERLSAFDPQVSKVGEVTDKVANLIISGGSSVGGIGAEAVDTALTGLEVAYGVIVEASTGFIEMLEGLFNRS